VAGALACDVTAWPWLGLKHRNQVLGLVSGHEDQMFGLGLVTRLDVLVLYLVLGLVPVPARQLLGLLFSLEGYELRQSDIGLAFSTKCYNCISHFPFTSYI